MTRVIETLWRQKHEYLQSIARGVSPDPNAAEDILQEAFTKLLESRRDFAESADAFRFLCRIVNNIAIDNRRTLRRRYQMAKPNRDPRSTATLWLAHTGNGVRNADYFGVLIGAEREILMTRLMHEIRTVMKALPQKQKEAIDLMFFRGEMTLKEVCRDKGIPYSTLRSRMQRGVDRIRDRLRRRGYIDSPGDGEPDRLRNLEGAPDSGDRG